MQKELINLGRIKDLTGEVFGKLKVLEITPERRNRQVVWKCQCECGNITYVVGQALRSGHTKSCGCLNYEKKDTDSLINQRFGKLTVLARAEKNLNHKIYWHCVCDCGNTLDVLSTDLRNNNINACENCRDYNYSYKNLLGNRYGLLSVIEKSENRSLGRVMWKCKCDCGTICEIKSNSLINGTTASCGCLSHHSIGEALITNYLNDNGYLFKRQQTFDNCRSPKNSRLIYDFSILNSENNIVALIEFDGEQHFKPIEFFGGIDGFQYLQECDIIKNNYAINNHIPLLRISYKDKNNLITILDNFLKDIKI